MNSSSQELISLLFESEAEVTEVDRTEKEL